MLFVSNHRAVVLLQAAGASPRQVRTVLPTRVAVPTACPPTSACSDAAVREGSPEWPLHLYSTTGMTAGVLLLLLLLLQVWMSLVSEAAAADVWTM